MTIVQAHAALSSTATLLSARRAVYQLAAEGLGLLDGPPAAGSDVPPAVDNPLFRNAVHMGLTSVGASEDRQGRLHRWPLGGWFLEFGTRRIPVLSAHDADTLLTDVLSALTSDPVSFLTEGDGSRFDAAFATLQQGVALAGAASPAIAADVLAHVSLVAVLRRDDPVVPVVSASLREFPGMLVLVEPRHAHEAAEAVMHEAAHSRFFDMAIVHDLLPPDCDVLEHWEPSWRPGVRWPVEQVVAALHAYSVLSEFADDLRSSGRNVPPWENTLLPHAAERAREIGDWVDGRLAMLGRDASAFVNGLRGQPAARDLRPTKPAADAHGLGLRVLDGLRVTSVDGGGAVASVGIPARLFVLGSDSGLVLSSLIEHEQDDPIRAAVTAYSRRRRVSRGEAAEAVRGILASLSAMSLVELPAAGPPAVPVRRRR